MKIFKDIWVILTSLNLIDYILFFGVVMLICLIVSLIYVLNNERDEEMEEEPKKESNDGEIDLLDIVNKIDENPTPIADLTKYEEEQEQKAIISYDELVKSANNEISYAKEEMVDDVIPVKQIQVAPMELPKKINDSTDLLAGLTQKEPKFEVDNNDVSETKEFKLFSYEKEEAFLKALKQLEQLLN